MNQEKPGMVDQSKDPTDMHSALAFIAAMASNAEWLCADECAFTLGMVTPKGKINRRGFLERVAVRSSFPRPWKSGVEKRWKRAEVLQRVEDERSTAISRGG